jgi:hypothetical protein
MVAVLADALGTADQGSLSALVEGRVCLIDGTLVPTFNWRHRTDLTSGKHRRHGMNIQLLVDLHGRIIAVSRPSRAAGTTCTASGKPAGAS